jgi:Spy/CpxP family protein refolding chaperone
MGLVFLEQVQQELDLIDEQVADLQKLREEARSGERPQFGGDFRNLSEEERNQRMEQMRAQGERQRADARRKMEEILLPQQFERLQQISLQVRGAAALNDEEIASQLRLSADQKQQLDTIREEGRARAGELFGGGGGGQVDRDAMRQRFEEYRREQSEKLLGVLTSSQRAEFEKMQGDKFELDLTAIQNRGGPGAPGGPGGFRRPDGQGGPGGFRRPDGQGGPPRRPGGDGNRPQRPDRPDGDRPDEV